MNVIIYCFLFRNHFIKILENADIFHNNHLKISYLWQIHAAANLSARLFLNFA